MRYELKYFVCIFSTNAVICRNKFGVEMCVTQKAERVHAID